MMNADAVRDWKMEPGRQAYVAKDVILYALGAGAGADPRDLDYVYEARLKALPTMAAVMAGEGPWMVDPRAGIDFKRLLHGEQRLTLHRPFPAQGDLIGQASVEGLYDRGAGKGAVLRLKRELRDLYGGPLAD